jgi:hypothetical protein
MWERKKSVWLISPPNAVLENLDFNGDINRI